MVLRKGKIYKTLAVFLLILMTFLTGCGGNTQTGTGDTSSRSKSGCENCTCYKKNKESEDTGSGWTDTGETDKPGYGYSKNEDDSKLDENGSYTSKEDVSNYLIQYGRLPNNFITKKEARKLGWHGGNLNPYAPGKCIGGDYFGNYQKDLPVVKGRTYHECDIDTLGAKSRGPKRLIYSDDGNIYYTENHYETFEFVYGDDQ